MDFGLIGVDEPRTVDEISLLRRSSQAHSFRAGRSGAEDRAEAIEAKIGLSPYELVATEHGHAVGIRKHAPEVRHRACEQAVWLGLDFDADASGAGGPRITKQGRKATAWVIPTDQDPMIARHTWQLMGKWQSRKEQGTLTR